MKMTALIGILIVFQSLQAQTSIIVLGTIQDAGSPQIGCTKDCCKNLFNQPDHSRQVVSLGLYNSTKKISYLFEATPDISKQLRMLKEYSKTATDIPNGVFLTHAHIGHYTGLMFLGKEAMSAKQLPVYAMPKMKSFLEQNGPWSQLVNQQNIQIQTLSDNQAIRLGDSISVTPLLVPHRDEYSETVGYIISGPSKKLLFIPDIDKWEKWSQNINHLIEKVDYALIDATFFDAAEINNRPISEIPHPFVTESMERFKSMPLKDKQKIHFIHFNHTNPLINNKSIATEKVIKAGFNIAQPRQRFVL
ncbi:MAG: pyrroloquinoline quinone biosynthesis protein PqqB [Sediminibacterium sp.]|nr:MAG: pyrroloquinoline quinone biosynthesis protein PqqB [Sediminibacterium sp.] [Sediminibacterium sp. FEMGT703S]